jgi:hypothetical protein
MDLRLLPHLPYEARRELLEAASIQFEIAEGVCKALCDSDVRCPFCDAEPWERAINHKPTCPIYGWADGKSKLNKLINRLVAEHAA